jgi:hypothetical protein
LQKFLIRNFIAFMKSFNKIFKVEIDNSKARDTGMAMVLILLLFELLLGGRIFLKIAIPVLVINMVLPQFFYPLAYMWFGIAHLLGSFISRILLFLVYIFLVLPVGFLRRAIRKDSLNLLKWKQGPDSVFKTRDHLFTSSDIDKPY